MNHFASSIAKAEENDIPESERSNQILTVEPDPVAFSATPVGGSASFNVNLVNGGDQPINVSNVSISGTDASQFSAGSSGGLQVGANGSAPLSLSFEPTVCR